MTWLVTSSDSLVQPNACPAARIQASLKSLLLLHPLTPLQQPTHIHQTYTPHTITHI